MNISTKLLKAAAGQAGGGPSLDVDEVFSTFLYDGTGATQVIENGLKLGNSNDGGSAYLYDQGGSNKITLPDSSDFAFGTGDFTIEYWVWHNIDSGTGNTLDIHYSQGTYVGRDNTNVLMYNIGGGLSTVTNGTLANGQWHHIAFAREGTNLRIFINGVLKQTVTNSHNFVSDGNAPTIGSYYTLNGYSFDGYMSNFRLNKGTAVYTSAFTPSTSALTAVSGTVLLCLQNGSPFVDNSSSSHTITTNGNIRASDFGPFTGTSGEGGLVWRKSRTHPSNQGYFHNLIDTERGPSQILFGNSTSAQTNSYPALSSFNSNGFTMLGGGGSANQYGDTYVSWSFRKAPKFFDVVQFTVGSAGTDTVINHSLGSDVGMVITKIASTTSGWGVHHRDLVSANEYMLLNSNASAASYDTVSFSSTQVDLGTFWSTSYAGQTGIAYIFAHNNNDGGFGPDSDQDIIKCGSYTGVSATEISVDLGFEPQWVMIKRATGTSLAAYASWFIQDVMRGMVAKGSDAKDNVLYANQSQAEGFRGNGDSTDVGIQVHPNATGFTVPSTNSVEVNQAGETYIYMAIRRGPLAAPTDATKVFALQQDDAGGTEPAFVSGFPVDAAFSRNAAGTAVNFFGSRLIGANYLRTNAGNAETSNSDFEWDYMNGWNSEPSQGSSVISYMWKRARGYFDVVTWTGAGGTTNISHNLGVVPEMIWARPRSYADNWSVFHKDTTYDLKLDETNAESTGTAFGTPTSSVMPVTGGLNASPQTYIAFLFATAAGVSKVGSYTGNNSTNGPIIDCGFSSGPRFVLIKRVDNAGSWHVFDSVRGIVAGNDPYLFLNSTAVQTSDEDVIDPTSSGFQIVTANSAVNYPNDTYIFLAIA